MGWKGGRREPRLGGGSRADSGEVKGPSVVLLIGAG